MRKTYGLLFPILISIVLSTPGCKEDNEIPVDDVADESSANDTLDEVDKLEVLCSDDFETGDFSNELWQYNAPKNASVVITHPFEGSYSCQMFNYSPDNYAQRNFRLPGLLSTVNMSFQLYIPDGTEAWGGVAYRHDGIANNKIFRLWADNGTNSGNNGYNSLEKIGATLWGDGKGNSNLILDWVDNQSTTAVIGPKGATYQNFITAADHGSWIKVTFEVEMPTGLQSGDGYFKVWRNDSLILNEIPDNWRTGEVHGYQWGYLMGSANSGYPDGNTIMFIDNVVCSADSISYSKL